MPALPHVRADALQLRHPPRPQGEALVPEDALRTDSAGHRRRIAEDLSDGRLALHIRERNTRNPRHQRNLTGGRNPDSALLHNSPPKDPAALRDPKSASRYDR